MTCDFGLKPHGGVTYACRIKEFTHFTLVAEPVVSTTRLPLSRYIRNHSIFISVASALALVPPAVTPFSVSRPGKPAQSVGCKIHGSHRGCPSLIPDNSDRVADVPYTHAVFKTCDRRQQCFHKVIKMITKRSQSQTG